MKITRILNLSLLAKFTIVALLSTIAIAVVLAWGVQREIEERALRQQEENIVSQVERILNPGLTASDFAGPLNPERYSQIDSMVREYILDEHIVNIKIWNNEGLLIYSSLGEGANSYFPVTGDLADALRGEVHSKISSLEKAENVSERGPHVELLEVYSPVRPQGSGEIAGAYEVYHDMSIIEPGIAAMRRFIALSVGGGFLLLFASLFMLVRNASREIRRQSRENRQLLEAEQARRDELSTLYDVSRALAVSAPERDPILDLIVRRTVEVVHSTFARIMLLSKGYLVEQAAFPVRVLDRRFRIGRRIPVRTMTNCMEVMRRKEALVVHSDGFSGITGEERDILMLDSISSMCLVPLQTTGVTRGLLIIGEARSETREPFTTEKMSLVRGIADQTVSSLQRAELFEELESAYLSTVTSLAKAVEAKDTYTADHADKLASMVTVMGKKIGMTQEEMEDLRYGAILHDVGKIGVPDAVLQKPDGLDDDEWAIMRQHPVIGYHILDPIPRLKGAARIIRHHHERYDGGGYPDGLSGHDIPLGARILTVADSYSAIMDRRVYKEARTYEEAVSELRNNSGSQFDPQIVALFLEMTARGEIQAAA